MLKGLGLPNMAVLFPMRIRLFHAAYMYSFGKNGTGLSFKGTKHTHSCVLHLIKKTALRLRWVMH